MLPVCGNPWEQPTVPTGCDDAILSYTATAPTKPDDNPVCGGVLPERRTGIALHSYSPVPPFPGNLFAALCLTMMQKATLEMRGSKHAAKQITFEVSGTSGPHFAILWGLKSRSKFTGALRIWCLNSRRVVPPEEERNHSNLVLGW